jgi:DNA-binding SARP family transcriptional activator
MWTDGEPIAVNSARQRVVLAMLLMSANHVVTVDKLIDAVWGEAPPPSARGQIQICISALRRALGGPELIDTNPTGYAIRVARHQLDYLVFNDALAEGRAAAADGRLEDALAHLDRAVGLWSDAALADVPGQAAQTVAHRLQERRVMAIEDRVEIRLGLGGHRELVDELVALTTEHPLRERLWGFLMLALYRSGRQAEALSAYRSARKSLVDELGIEPGEQLRHLERAILAHDTSLRTTEDPDTAEPPRQVPQQLPADLPDFVGQSHLADELDTALNCGDASTVPIAVITGGPGCGKTTLAVHVAHRVRERFPDGILFGSLHGGTTQPRSTGALLGDFLRALGISADAVPAHLDERIKLLRSRMAGRRLLVVLDDAGSEDQIAGLLPGVAGPAVLVTSRSRLAGIPGARAVEVDMMSPQESRELLSRICGEDRVAASDEATGELTRMCGGLPLALRIAGVRLSAHPHWSVRTLVDRLSDERYRLDELAHGEVGIRSLLAEVYESLTDSAQRLLRLLSALQMHEFSTWNGAALLDCGVGQAAVLLDELSDARLLDADSSDVTGHPRYRLHGLVRVFAHERRLAQDDEAKCEEAVTRVLGGLLAFAEEAHLRLYGGNYTVLRGEAVRWAGARDWFDGFLGDPMAWFDEERGSLEAAIRQSAALGLDELCWELATTAVTMYEARGLFSEWRATHRAALEATRLADNRRGQAAVLASLGSLGVAQHSENDVEILEAAMRLFEEVGDETGLGLTLRNLAHLDRIQGRPRESVQRYELALVKFRATGDKGAQAHLLGGLARTYLDLDESARAEELAKESLALGQSLGNRRLQAQALHRLGEVFVATGQKLAAKAVFQEALDLTRVLGDRVGQAYALNGLGAVVLEHNELDAAEIYFTESIEICRTSNERNAHAHAVFGLGQVYAKRGEHTRAEHHFVQASNAFLEQENNPWYTRSLDELGVVRRAASRLSARRIELE